ncbi:pectinacetylesterase family protein, partial [Striga asiatica]
MWQGGGRCNSLRSCIYCKPTRRGLSTNFQKIIPLTGLLSNKAEDNLNKVKVRYCNGAPSAGDCGNESCSPSTAAGLHSRGHRIWGAAMDELMCFYFVTGRWAGGNSICAGGLAKGDAMVSDNAFSLSDRDDQIPIVP